MTDDGKPSGPGKREWWMPNNDRSPELGSKEHLELAGYMDPMTPDERAHFLYKRGLMDQMHGY